MVRIYNHLDLPEFEKAKQISQDGTGKRLYQTPQGNVYPSITTVLNHLSEGVLERWRTRVGDKVADHESKWGRDRGTVIHAALEKVLNNESLVGFPMISRMLVEDLKQYLLLIGDIHVQETPLYSDKFKIAGRCDTIGYYRGKLAVIDFKGSRKPKKMDWIEHYLLQVAFYAYAYWERTGIKIHHCVVLIACETGHPQEIIIEPWKYWKRLQEVREEYRRRENI